MKKQELVRSALCIVLGAGVAMATGMAWGGIDPQGPVEDYCAATAPQFAAELQLDGVKEVSFDLSAVESVRRIFTITGFARIIKFID